MTAKISSPEPPITPPMTEPKLLGPLVVSKNASQVPLVEIPLIALEVSDDEPVGFKIGENPNVACPKDELLTVEDWESVDDAAGVPEDGLEDDASFCTRRTERVKGWFQTFLSRQHPVCTKQRQVDRFGEKLG